MANLPLIVASAFKNGFVEDNEDVVQKILTIFTIL
jgi:hypothetical protein